MMIKRGRFNIKAIFYIPLFILGLFKGELLAAHGEFKMIEELEKQEKPASPERVVRTGVEYKAEGLRDPFKESAVPEGQAGGVTAGPEVQEALPPALTVTGLIWGGSLPQAIINDKVVKIGDIIEGAKVTGITKEGVSILFQGRQYNLSSPANQAGAKKP